MIVFEVTTKNKFKQNLIHLLYYHQSYSKHQFERDLKVETLESKDHVRI